MSLDQLLELAREPEPMDDGFVHSVMIGVHRDEQRRAKRRSLRRPMVTGIVAAVIVTGGAVAAVVSTHPLPTKPVDTKVSTPHTPITVTDAPDVVAGHTTTDQSKVDGFDVGAVPRSVVHTTHTIDKKTGLRLETETYSNDFVVGRKQRITLTLENTGKEYLSLAGPRDCGLQVMAFPNAPASADSDYRDRFEWVCAGSDMDPSEDGPRERYVLAPGDRRVADAFVTVKRSGPWSIVGICRCTYEKVSSSLTSRNDPLGDLTHRTVPAPLLPEQSEGKNLTTPGIQVRAQ